MRLRRASSVSVWRAIAATLLTSLVWRGLRPEAPTALARLSIMAPPGESLFLDPTGVAISPGGTKVAFVVGDATRSESQIWVRSLDSSMARKLDDAELALVEVTRRRTPRECAAPGPIQEWIRSLVPDAA